MRCRFVPYLSEIFISFSKGIKKRKKERKIKISPSVSVRIEKKEESRENSMSLY